MTGRQQSNYEKNRKVSPIRDRNTSTLTEDYDGGTFVVIRTKTLSQNARIYRFLGFMMGPDDYGPLENYLLKKSVPDYFQAVCKKNGSSV